MHREIPKFVDCPTLTPELTRLLSTLVYLPNHKPEKSDAILIFGNRNYEETASQLQQLIDLKISRNIIISGGNPKFEDFKQSAIQTESQHIFSHLKKPLNQKIHILLEEEASNTAENVTRSLSLLPKDLTSLTYICLWYISQRAYLSLLKYLPQHVKYFQYALPRKENAEIVIGPDTWTASDMGRNRTYAEYLRLKLYCQRGDIEYPDNVKKLVTEIDQLV
jgi:hypothetical protein